MVMVSPEELPSRDFNQLLGVKKFWDRIFALGVDKAQFKSKTGAEWTEKETWDAPYFLMHSNVSLTSLTTSTP
jgi:hypothetical protein